MLRKRRAFIALMLAAGVEATICVSPPGSALASDELRRCSSDDVATWTDCIGNYVISDIGTYVGEFRNGKPSGKGSLTYRAYGEYVGEFREGRPEGNGIYTYADGRQYVGDWHNGEFDGYGTLTYPDGRKEIGEWRAGNLIQQVEEDSHAQFQVAVLAIGIFAALALALRFVFANASASASARPQNYSIDTSLAYERRKVEEIRKRLLDAVDNFDVSDDALIELREGGRRASRRLYDLERGSGVARLLGVLKLS